jgi:hypothetical protein
MATGAIAEHMYDVYTQMDMGLERAFYVFRGRGLYWSKPHGKNPNVAVASMVFAATSSNEQKPDLTCTVCSISSTGQKAMQDHLEGKLHKRKAARQPMPKQDVVTDMVSTSPTPYPNSIKQYLH